MKRYLKKLSSFLEPYVQKAFDKDVEVRGWTDSFGEGKKNVPQGSEMLRRDVRNVNSNEFKDFIRAQGNSFKSNEWKKLWKHGKPLMEER